VDYEPHVIQSELDNLEADYSAIKAAAPNAKIVVLGYAHILPDTVDEANSECVSPLFGFLGADAVWLNQMADLLDSTIQQAAQAEGVTFVDPRTAFHGHDACAGTPYINGTEVPGTGSFHPNAAGMNAYASLVEAADPGL
jgi:hypothetical protein